MTEKQAIEAIRKAIRDPGSHPEHHAFIMKEHRKEWPTLWRAIDALMQARN